MDTPLTNSVIETARKQVSQRASLETQLVELEKRRDLARRRLAGYAADQAGNQKVWLGTPSQIVGMKQRLHQACTDTEQLLAIVNEVREKREVLTNQALNHYAKQIPE